MRQVGGWADGSRRGRWPHRPKRRAETRRGMHDPPMPGAAQEQRAVDFVRGEGIVAMSSPVASSP